MKRKVLRTLKAAIAFSLVFSLSVPAFAASEKEQAEQTLAALKEQKAALQNRLANLQANKADTESYIAELDKELAAVYSEIERLTGELEQTQADLEQTQKDLEAAKEKEAEQYAALKARIKAMYEAGDTSLMEIFMQAEDISTILNATDYISKISDYDNQLLTNLNETRKEIERIEAKLEEQKAQLEELKAEEEAKQEELELIMDAKKAELESLNIDIYAAYDDISNTEAEINTTNKILADIAYREEQERIAREKEAQRQKELAAQQAANNSSSNNAGTSNGTGSDSGNSTSTGNGTATTAPSTTTPSTSSGTSGGSVSLGWPCPSSSYISSYYGGRTSPTAGASSNHKGIDIAAGSGSSIVAAASGTVTTSSYSSARGYYVVISHGNGISTLYQHCSSVYVSAGQSVSQGQSIAAVGSTGISSGPHLHYEVLVNGVNVDPMNYY